MLISLNWLKDFVKLPKNLDPQKLANDLTLKTAEVEGVVNQGKGFEGVVIGEILEFKKHPNADKLNVAKVDIGKDKPLNLIFGQMVTMKIGNKVPVAIAPTILPTGIKVEKKDLRGEPSEGMLCLDQELGLKKEGVDIQYFPNAKPGTPFGEAANLDDIILEFDNKALTHRPDLWGHCGIAREVAAITDSEFIEMKPTPKIPTKGESLKVEVKDQKLCPRYCGLIIENIKITDSPDWLKKRLQAVGQGTHNNIVDVTNYIMAELGQPLHAFDKNFIEGGIVVRRAAKNEKITTLDDKQRTLDEHILVISDHKKAVAVAGVIGGENSEINEKTTSIILESANFNGASVRRSATKLGLRTDAVQRFEKSLDPNLAETAIKRATELILQICPEAKIAGPISDISNFSNTPITVNLEIEKVQSKIGVKISAKEIKNILEKLFFTVKEKDPKNFIVTIPTFRASKDVSIEDDLVEEVARLYGYEKISAQLPILPAKLPTENLQRFKKHRIRELLSYGLGFDEVYNYSFYNKKDLENSLLSEEGHLKILNYLSEDQTHLRISLIPNLLKSIAQNIRYYENFKVYEIGHTYKEIGQYFPLEEKFIAGAIITKGGNDDCFYEAKGAAQSIFEKFNINNLKAVKKVEHTPYAHPVKAVSYIEPSGKTLTKVFILHPKVAKNYDLRDHSVALFEINFTDLMKLDNPPRKYRQIPKFPTIEFDISVLIDKNVEIAEIEKNIMRKDQGLITNIELFDIYHGEGIPEDKKAVAFKIILQAADRTLTDNEMTQVQNQIFQNLEKLGGTIRGK